MNLRALIPSDSSTLGHWGCSAAFCVFEMCVVFESIPGKRISGRKKKKKSRVSTAPISNTPGIAAGLCPRLSEKSSSRGRAFNSHAFKWLPLHLQPAFRTVLDTLQCYFNPCSIVDLRKRPFCLLFEHRGTLSERKTIP